MKDVAKGVKANMMWTKMWVTMKDVAKGVKNKHDMGQYVGNNERCSQRCEKQTLDIKEVSAQR